MPSKHRKVNKNQKLVYQYGITFEEYLGILEEQGYQCAICEQDLKVYGKGTHLDHCHDTEKVRGILCRNCNTGLGMFKDNASLLNKAIEYLRENNID